MESSFLEKFYDAFKNKDFATMQSLYHPKAVFNDEAFTDLDAYKAGKMWEMLISRGKDLELKYKILNENETKGQVQWIAKYSFGKQKRMVINVIEASFEFSEGKIIKHTDRFDFYKWARQGFGFPGMLLGWTPFFKNKVQKTAMQNLESYIESHP